MSNLFLGLLAAAGFAELWIATLCPHPPIARNRPQFVLVTAGLVTALILNSLVLRARLQSDVTPVFAAGLLQTWMYAGPLLAGCLNLALLIHERSRMSERRTLAPVRRMACRSLTFGSSQPCGRSCSGPISYGRRSTHGNMVGPP